MSLTRRIARLVAIGLLTPVVFLLGCQSRLIYYPKPYGKGDMDSLRRVGGRQLDYRTAQGRQAAFYVPPATDPAKMPQRVWLCFAGNGSLALDWLWSLDGWDRTCGYLLIDYPHYGACEGKPSPASIGESSVTAVRRLAEHLHVSLDELKPRLSVLGHSIGCAAALMAADDLDSKRAVLISPFTTMTDMGRIVLGRPLCWLNLHRFDNRLHLANMVKKGATVTIFHGTEDEVIPIRMSRELASAQPRSVKLVEVPGADHNFIVSMAAKEISDAMRR